MGNGERREFRLTPGLGRWLSETGCTRAPIEGGSYEGVLAAALRAAELPVAIVNPRQRSLVKRVRGAAD
jgi:transposase